MTSYSPMRILAIAALTVFGQAALAAPKPVQLPAITHSPASLTVVEEDGDTVTYDPAGLEQLRTYRLTTRPPWRTEPADFDGVLLADLLAAHGLDDADHIVVTAENDFQVRIPREAWEGLTILVATRVDDKPHSRRERGPIQFVVDEAEIGSPLYSENYLVWMAARIEAAAD